MKDDRNKQDVKSEVKGSSSI